jgi:hypothetical protein
LPPFIWSIVFGLRLGEFFIMFLFLIGRLPDENSAADSFSVPAVKHVTMELASFLIDLFNCSISYGLQSLKFEGGFHYTCREKALP